MAGKDSKKIQYVDKGQKQAILKRVNAQRLCDKLKLEVFMDTGQQLRTNCPIHRGDNPTAFSIDYGPKGEMTAWMCRTECGESGDAFKLISKVYNIPFIAAVNWLADFVGITNGDLPDQVDPGETVHEDDVDDYIRMTKGGKMRPANMIERSSFITDESVEKWVSNSNDYFEKRGYPKWILEKFKVGFCKAGQADWLEDRVTVPFWDVDGNLVGVSGRLLFDSKFQKYKILKGSNKKEHLYGLNFALPYILKSGSVIIVEGFTDVWKCWMHGKRNVVAVMGKSLTIEQRRLILGLVHTVAIAFDGDKEGQLGAESAIESLVDFCTVFHVNPGNDNDIGDLERDEFYDALKLAVKRFKNDKKILNSGLENPE